MNTIAALMLCGCGGADTEKSPDAGQPPSENRALLDAAKQPLERARGVDDVAAGRKGELDEQIEGAPE